MRECEVKGRKWGLNHVSKNRFEGGTLRIALQSSSLSGAYNTGYTASLRYAKICSAIAPQTSYSPISLGEIVNFYN